VVRKEVQYTDDKREKVDKEVAMLQKLRHPHIVKYLSSVCALKTKKLYIFMEYCERDLNGIIKDHEKAGQRMNEGYIWRAFYQLSQGLAECHLGQGNGQKILHRDIKPANIFVDSEENFKLGDFGLARMLEEDKRAKTVCGTRVFSAPEVRLRVRYDEKCDTWSLGCVLFCMCTLRKAAFRGNNGSEMDKNIINRILAEPIEELRRHYSKDLCKFVDLLLTVDAPKRPSIKAIINDATFQARTKKFTLEGFSSKSSSSKSSSKSSSSKSSSSKSLLSN